MIEPIVIFGAGIVGAAILDACDYCNGRPFDAETIKAAVQK